MTAMKTDEDETDNQLQQLTEISSTGT